MFCLLLVNIPAQCQCSNAIQSYPYFENFETASGNWVPGGTTSDWAWGIVSKPVITSASASFKCWVTGGLNASFYNFSERSYVESPCFNFSNVTNPYVRFDFFCETERQYDGASFQYSIDNGNTWNNVGAYNDAQNCLNANWFNTSAVNGLSGLSSNKNGWSGNIQPTQGNCTGGGGTGTWQTAQHQMPYLTGNATVKFRFIFGAGSQCNSFDGFAFDNVYISESPLPLTASFTNQDAGCNQSNGSSAVSVSGGQSPYSLSWVGQGNTTPVLANIPAGNYTVLVTDQGGCTALFSTMVSPTPPVLIRSQTANDTCEQNKGSILIMVTQGKAPFNYQWTNYTGTSAAATQLKAGNYGVVVTDANQCTAQGSFTIQNIPAFTTTLTSYPDTCNGRHGAILVSTSGGTSPFTYSCNGQANLPSLVGNLSQGSYKLTISDASGCRVNDSIVLGNVNNLSVSLNPYYTFCGNNAVSINPGSYTSYLWSTGDTFPVTNTSTAGLLWVEVTNAQGCRASDTTLIVEDCLNDVLLPAAFTPNNDGKNDFFQAYYSQVNSLQLLIFNRFGEIVFETDNRNFKWDGYQKGKPCPQDIYIVVMHYSIEGKKFDKRQTVLLLR